MKQSIAVILNQIFSWLSDEAFSSSFGIKIGVNILKNNFTSSLACCYIFFFQKSLLFLYKNSINQIRALWFLKCSLIWISEFLISYIRDWDADSKSFLHFSQLYNNQLNWLIETFLRANSCYVHFRYYNRITIHITIK